MKILLVEDDFELASQLKGILEKASFAVDCAADGETGLFQAEEFTYDCLILDINLPDMTGFEVCEKLRNQKNTTPILMLTARGGIDDRVRGLDIGADDYVTKPVNAQELVARVKAIIRRNSKDPLPVLQIGTLVINPQTREVTRDGQSITLNTKEFAVLEYLARHSNEVVTRTMIMEHVWGSDFETLSNVVDVYVRYLRKKIDSKFEHKLIHTIRGGGYTLSTKR